MRDSIQVSRRDPLKPGGGALVVAFTLGDRPSKRMPKRHPSRSLWRSTEVDLSPLPSFMGRELRRSTPGARSTWAPDVRQRLAQIAADELDLPMSKVRIVQGDTALTPDQGTTWGSLHPGRGAQICQAAAAARAKLLSESGDRARGGCDRS